MDKTALEYEFGNILGWKVVSRRAHLMTDTIKSSGPMTMT